MSKINMLIPRFSNLNPKYHKFISGITKSMPKIAMLLLELINLFLTQTN